MANDLTQNKEYKSGFVAVIGRPNVGKSTLLNALLGRKVSIVSPKPQTTRDKISGILTADSYQIVFEDTPGITDKKDGLSRHMQRCVSAAIGAGDIILLVIDAFKGVSEIEREIIKTHGANPNFICAVNKIDAAKPEKVMPLLKELSLYTSGEIIPISARFGSNLDVLLNKITSALPKGQMYYPEDMVTDKNKRFMAAEIIREKILYNYQQEIPHGVGVAITEYSFIEEKNLTEIHAEIYCEKPGHKKILIGKNGEALKKTATEAREDIELLLEGGKVFLSLWIKVRPGWKDSRRDLKELGYG
jgi:GTP-binding protein Era